MYIEEMRLTAAGEVTEILQHLDFNYIHGNTFAEIIRLHINFGVLEFLSE